MTTQTYHRARHSAALLHAHRVFVTNYRRPVLTDAMLTFDQTMRGVCAQLAAKLVEFNSEADHLHLLVAYPPHHGRSPTSSSPALVHRCRSSSRTSMAKPDRSKRRAPPGDKPDGKTPA
ncbi:IS200/IS605 family transposase [Mycobacterium sp.]|uniref:IS200/IS605 family transposase n=1 Tax=Mycobacterium sp. TaxID=1785 RepID=UPI003C75E5E6